MSSEMLPESFKFFPDGEAEFIMQMARIKGALESLVLDLAAADTQRPPKEDHDLAY